jgi:hypothetical protein
LGVGAAKGPSEDLDLLAGMQGRIPIGICSTCAVKDPSGRHVVHQQDFLAKADLRGNQVTEPLTPSGRAMTEKLKDLVVAELPGAVESDMVISKV